MSLIRGVLLLTLIALPARAEDPLAVEIVTARAEASQHRLSLLGEVRAHDTLNASFPMGGRITDVFFDAGETVAPGAVLARLDSVQQEQALRSAEAALSTATADFRQAAEDFDRQEALLARGATTRIARDSAEDALSIARGVLAQAQADLDRAKKAVADTVLLAPETATVTKRMVEAGQIVGAAQPVLELALGKDMDAVFEAPEVSLSSHSKPKVVVMNLLDRPDVTFEGQIDEISPVVNSKTGTVTVKVAIQNPPAELAFGEPVRGTVEGSGPPRVILPYSSISTTSEGPAVWQIDPETMAVSSIPITIDRYETGRILVSSGIADGTKIVSKGTQLLYPGRIVRAVEEQK